jgi:hypothetical protein
MGKGDAFPWSKVQGLDTSPSVPSNAEVKDGWTYTSTSLYIFMSGYLTKHWRKFTFLSIKAKKKQKQIPGL